MVSKRDKILQTALELFTVQGFKATTTKEIAIKSGVAEGLIFYYFKDKNELLNHLLHEFSFIGSIREEMKELSGIDPYQALIKFGHLYTNFLFRHKSFLTFIWSPEMVQNKEVSKEVANLISSMSEHVAMNLTRAVSGPVEKQTMETATSMFISSLLTHVLVGERISDKISIENDNYIEDVVNLLLKGLESSN